MLALSWLIHTCRLWRERTRHSLLLDRLLRRERGCTSHRLLHWLSLCINLWRELLLHWLLVLGLLILRLTCTLHLPCLDAIEVLTRPFRILPAVTVEMQRDPFALLQVKFLYLGIPYVEHHTFRVLTRLMLQYVRLAHPLVTTRTNALL